MAYEINGELVLNAEETVALVYNMLHPNVEACMRRDEFLRDLSDLHIDLTNGEITANCPDIQLPSELQREGHLLYDDSKLNRFELVEGKIVFEESDEDEWFNSHFFRENEQSRYPELSGDDRWIGSGNGIAAMNLEAA